MTAAVSLAAAAGQSYDDLSARFIAGQLKNQLNIFWSQNIGLFPEQEPSSHPVSNWLTVLAALTDQLPPSNITLQQLTAAAQVMYRLCWMASFLQGSGGISPAQGNTLLASYNTVIGFP